MNFPKAILIFLVLLFLCVIPAAGLKTYTDGMPQMTAVISGTNQFSPGQDATITLVVQNRGVSTMESNWSGNAAYEGTGTIARDDVPTTAKMVTVSLSSGNAPIVIKTDPQNIGDIASMGSKTVNISAKITSDATNGEYQLPVTIAYTYLAKSQELAVDTLQSTYVKKDVTLPVTVRIKPQVKIDVLEAVPDHVSVGTSGYLNLTIRNTGFEDGKKATVRILRSGKSPIVPTDSSIYIGDFPRGGDITCRYKVSVSKDAEKQTYPVDVVVTYENREGDIVTTAADTVGIPVEDKLTFSVTSGNISVVQGSDTVITVTYRNNGIFTAYNAQARLSAVDPFTSTDNTAYLGDIKPGESAVGQYKLSTTGDAAPGSYSLDNEIRYRDSLDNSQISDSFKLPIQIVQKPASSGIFQILPVLILIVLIAAGAGYYLLVMRKKK
nr:S-layer protein [uncultured Methanoregula sp.]